MTRRMTRRTVVAAGLTALLVLAACSDGSVAPVAERAPGRREVYVAIGNGETAGNGVRNRIRDAWPQIVFRTDLPRATVFTNFGTNDASVESAFAEQLAPALALEPTIATVHLTEDTFLTRDPVGYERNLTRLVRQLQRGGRTEVVVGNLVPGDREPGLLACLPDPPPNGPECRLGPISDLNRQTARDEEFNQAIARVAKATGSRLVDLNAAFLRARAAGTEDALWAGNDFSPNVKGHQLMAREFGTAVRAALKSRA